MPISPLVPILCLFAGAILGGLGALVRFRWTSLMVALGTGAAAVTMLPLMRRLPASAVTLDWRPVTLLGSTVSLRVDTTAWLLGMTLLLAGFSAALVWRAVPGQAPSAPCGLACIMLAAGLGSVFAANLLTLALCWGMLDALFCLLLLTRGDPTSGRRAQLALGLNGLATLILWTVVLLIEQERLSSYWHLLIPPPTVRTLMGLAAALRLGLYPLHIWRPVGQGGEWDRAILIHLIPAMAGLSLWARLAIVQGLPGDDVWPVLALIAALIGGVQAWIQSDSSELLPHLAFGYGGMLILVTTTSKAPAATLVAGCASWLIGLTLFFVGRPVTRATWPWAIPSVLGMATLVGLPFTPGFADRIVFYQSASAGPVWIFGFALVVEILLIGAMVRRLLTSDVLPLPQGRLAKIGYMAAPIAAVTPMIVFGVMLSPTAGPMSSLGALAWIGWGVPLIGAVALAFVAEPVRARVSGWSAGVSNIFRLDWVYSLLLPLMRAPARLGLLVADLLDGDGAFLWMLLILALVMIYLRGSPAS